ncbi:response regulator [Burkholderia mayonis]|uniref:Response regulatory domain-containing protein n=1 Tax=Burkholderia mayonis TaxID=1385591 RepID=A0A1B4FQH6_9BURK|nr:response regulator [Burkholderia mayonis]AOJ05931.1 hypothetical protein WS71_00280 [Burkholderia mayonis]KVE54038.1 hypothetical protein WS71_00055 [Burkholderia mayonis]
MPAILIVDDHPAIGLAIRTVLSRGQDFGQFYEAANAAEAMALLREHPIELLSSRRVRFRRRTLTRMLRA